MRLMCAAAVSLAVGLFLAFADEKKPSDTKATRADQLKTLQKKFDKERDDLKRQYDLSKDNAERNGIKEEVRELAILTARDAMKLAEEDPKDATGFDAALFVVEKTGGFGSGKEFDAAITLIGEHHLNNPKVKDMLPRIASAGPAGQKFLQNASEKANDKDVKGLALFFLGIAASAQLEEEEDDKKIEELIARAVHNFQKAAKEAPDTKVGNTTIGKEVATQLETLQAFKNLAVGKPVPDVEGTDLSGKKIKLSSYKGKVVLLDIWATWCGPCRAMIPHEREMVKKLKNKPFTLLSVSCDDEQETLVKFFEKEQMPWDHWFDGRGGSVAKTFRIRAFPTMYLIDHSGILRNKWIGNPGDDKLEKAIEDLVNDAVKAKG
ncbi:MAG TPA: TlpA disulfide reductase family protein [Gemmata sp.]|jgi:thiol-disulfide isomerase/thioredoxin|nr:TlpA disulfide reductase family protein [Gemmata sp.]